MSDILFVFFVGSTKIGEISDISKCFENFVSQTLGVLARIYAAELRSNIEIDPFGLDCKAQSNIYKGVQEASQILKERGLPRQVRKNILQSFDVRTIKVRLARTNEYGIRFHDKGLKATANGRYLFKTFPASRNSLAIKPEWNNMKDIKQWQIKKEHYFLKALLLLKGT